MIYQFRNSRHKLQATNFMMITLMWPDRSWPVPKIWPVSLTVETLSVSATPRLGLSWHLANNRVIQSVVLWLPWDKHQTVISWNDCAQICIALVIGLQDRRWPMGNARRANWHGCRRKRTDDRRRFWHYHFSFCCGSELTQPTFHHLAEY